MSEIGVENLTKGVHHTHTSGGRTRGVVNLASPGGEGTVAFTYADGATADGAITAVPTLATDGFKNFGLNKTLHAVFSNDSTGATHTFAIWGYHSFAQKWAKLNVFSQSDGTDGAHAPLAISVANDIDTYLVIPIEGIERVYVQKTDTNNIATDKALYCYLGVNTI